MHLLVSMTGLDTCWKRLAEVSVGSSDYVPVTSYVYLIIVKKAGWFFKTVCLCSLH